MALQRNLNSNHKIKTFRILLDAGHGAGKAHNRGALYYNEGDNNFYYSLVLKRELEKIPGVEVDLVRKNINDNPHIYNRSSMGAGYDLFLSLHSNAAARNVRGTEIFDSIERPNKALATKLVNALSNTFNHSNRGVKYKEGKKGWNWYGVLRGNKAKSSMIVEMGFHTNDKDCLFFKNNHLKIATATANTIASHYNLTSGNQTNKPEIGGNNMTYYNRNKNNRAPGVRKLQADLSRLGHTTGVDGIFGPDTEKVVIDFQKKYKLGVDGSAGPETLNKIASLIYDLDNKKKPQEKRELYHVQVGAYGEKQNADNMIKKLKALGIDGFIKKE